MVPLLWSIVYGGSDSFIYKVSIFIYLSLDSYISGIMKKYIRITKRNLLITFIFAYFSGL